MALKKCRECSGKVSSSAKTCPHCGVKSPYASPRGCLTFLLFVGIVAFFAMNDKNDKKADPEYATTKLTPQEQQDAKDFSQMLIQAKGYQCNKVDDLIPAPFGGKVTVFCDGIYDYTISDEGGKHVVTVN
ncbi:hypothetical protein [Pantoea sp. CTOTU50773]|uniref:hypothetical protein n=1 Tax=Pantoea sp. CTOTU50773 TaxID=2953853 RepID=UPI0028B09C63|nr:hypothetical protein [Pantoea sp. CTOTU50773]